MKPAHQLLLVAATLVLGACASKPAATTATPQPAAGAGASAPAGPAPVKVKSRDGTYEGEVIGRAHPGSKFQKLVIGMHMDEVQNLLGRAPDRLHTYESGKRWIPFYFGNDARRMQVLYKGEGCLTFTGGNVWGGAAGDLIGIQYDTTGACYQP